MNLIQPEIDAYATAFSMPEPEVLKELHRQTYLKTLMPQMISSWQQGLFLQFLVKITRAKQVLEIGTFTGYSGICMAMGLPADGLLHSIEINEELEEMVLKYVQKANVAHCFRLYIGHALDIIPTFTQSFDMVFIDADKKNYSSYYDLIFPKVKVGGLIIADNVLWSGKVLKHPSQHDKDTASLHQFNQKILSDNRVENLLLPLRDGLMIMRKIQE
ncbi:MAG: class I SAM-dependent methyltransferase [Cytophagales bacterium]|nr:class I SAM-dependent methyltransferase [Cytophagales bacterium]MDW8384945.1 class I SAM-dependent methyltransferase [Flammeovirgaceae bacterium]